MRYLLIFFGFLFCSQLSISQSYEWAPIGAKWWYAQWSFSGYDRSFASIRSVKDTVLQGQNCRVLELYFANSDSDPGTKVLSTYTYKQNGVVRYTTSPDEPLRTLYHFNAQVGDTVVVYPWEQFDTDSLYYAIDSIEVATISGKSIKVMHTSIVEAISSDSYYMSTTWYAGIGSALFFMPQFGAMDPPLTGELRCYEEDSLGLVNILGIPCDSTISVGISNTVSSGERLRISPNPGGNQIKVQVAKAVISPPMYLRVIHIDGRVVVHEKMLLEEQTISTSAWPAGLYLVEVYHENDLLERKKWIKQ